MTITAVLFFCTAVLYAAVGFGGGSTYTALLVLNETDYTILPVISLVCNIIVVTGGTWHFHRQNLIPWKKAWPVFITSVPMAWFGGRILIEESTFVLLLGAALLFAGFAMLFKHKSSADVVPQQNSNLPLSAIGAILGLVSGMVGIGGGIFLAPALYLLKWESSKAIAGVCSSFILINSVAGLAGQLSKSGSSSNIPLIADYWPLFVAVLVGGQIGSLMGSSKLNPEKVKLLTAMLVLFVGSRLLYRTLSPL